MAYHPAYSVFSSCFPVNSTLNPHSYSSYSFRVPPNYTPPNKKNEMPKYNKDNRPETLLCNFCEQDSAYGTHCQFCGGELPFDE